MKISFLAFIIAVVIIILSVLMFLFCMHIILKIFFYPLFLILSGAIFGLIWWGVAKYFEPKNSVEPGLFLIFLNELKRFSLFIHFFMKRSFMIYIFKFIFSLEKNQLEIILAVPSMAKIFFLLLLDDIEWSRLNFSLNNRQFKCSHDPNSFSTRY